MSMDAGSWLDKAKAFVKGNPDKAREALKKAEEAIDKETGGKYTDQIDKGGDALGGQLGIPDEQASDSTPAPSPAAEPGTTVSPDAPTDNPGETDPQLPPSGQ